jgi:hypothetical protein
MPPHLRSQREGLAKAFPRLSFASIPTKLFIYKKGATVPFLVFERDGSYYKNEHKCVTSVREALEYAMGKL